MKISRVYLVVSMLTFVCIGICSNFSLPQAFGAAANNCTGTAEPDGNCSTGTMVDNCRCDNTCANSGSWYCETTQQVKIKGSGGKCKGTCKKKSTVEAQIFNLDLSTEPDPICLGN